MSSAADGLGLLLQLDTITGRIPAVTSAAAAYSKCVTSKAAITRRVILHALTGMSISTNIEDKGLALAQAVDTILIASVCTSTHISTAFGTGIAQLQALVLSEAPTILGMLQDAACDSVKSRAVWQ